MHVTRTHHDVVQGPVDAGHARRDTPRRTVIATSDVPRAQGLESQRVFISRSLPLRLLSPASRRRARVPEEKYRVRGREAGPGGRGRVGLEAATVGELRARGRDSARRTLALAVHPRRP